jgi:hypothetical protein
VARGLRRLARRPASLSRASSLLAVLTVIVAVGGMLVTSERAIEAERFATETARAQAVAGYLSLVVPWGASGYPPARLLSTASAIRNSATWSGGLQVASGETGLLPDPLGISPLPGGPRDTRARGVMQLDRPGTGPIAVVPLLDPAQRGRAGWVAAWGSLPARRWPQLVVVLVCLTLAGALAARWLPLAAIANGLVLATMLWLSVRAIAREGTDTVLLTACRLAEISSTPEGGRVSLDRLGPGLQWSVRRGAAPRGRDLKRRRVGGRPEAMVVAGLPGGRVVEITTSPRESRLGTVQLALAGWLALLGAGIGIGARAGTPPRS